VLPANVRLDWKVIARCKHSSLFGLIVTKEGKKFYNIATWCQSYETVSPITDALQELATVFLSQKLFQLKMCGLGENGEILQSFFSAKSDICGFGCRLHLKVLRC
jgi:hypothetical protein